MNRGLVRWDPFRDISTLQDQIDRLFADTLGRFQGPREETLDTRTWAPAMDIVEKENEILLRADLPGVDPKDVDINVQEGTLTLKGERKFESDVKEKNFCRVERVYGSFVRSFALPQTVDPEGVQAEYRDGVLELKLPKRPEAKPKQIKVAVKK